MKKAPQLSPASSSVDKPPQFLKSLAQNRCCILVALVLCACGPNRTTDSGLCTSQTITGPLDDLSGERSRVSLDTFTFSDSHFSGPMPTQKTVNACSERGGIYYGSNKCLFPSDQFTEAVSRLSEITISYRGNPMVRFVAGNEIQVDNPPLEFMSNLNFKRPETDELTEEQSLTVQSIEHHTKKLAEGHYVLSLASGVNTHLPRKGGMHRSHGLTAVFEKLIKPPKPISETPTSIPHEARAAKYFDSRINTFSITPQVLTDPSISQLIKDFFKSIDSNSDNVNTTAVIIVSKIADPLDANIIHTIISANPMHTYLPPQEIIKAHPLRQDSTEKSKKTFFGQCPKKN